MSSVPRGFSKDDPAEAYLRHRNFLAGREFPPEFATTAAFYPTLVATFKAVMPIVRFLNEPLVARPDDSGPPVSIVSCWRGPTPADSRGAPPPREVGPPARVLLNTTSHSVQRPRLHQDLLAATGRRPVFARGGTRASRGSVPANNK